MKARLIVALIIPTLGALAIAGYRYGSPKSIPPTSTIRSDWPGLFPMAEAAPTPCGAGIRRIEVTYKTEVIPYTPSYTEWEICKASPTGPTVPIHRPTRTTHYCDGRVDPTGAAGPSRCDAPNSNCSAPNTWDYSQPCFSCPFSCLLAPPTTVVECEGKCPEKEKCHDDASGTTQVGNPVCVAGSPSSQGQGSLIYELPLFAPPSGGGFPSTLSVHLFGQEAYEAGTGSPLGPRAMHSLAPSMIYGTGTPSFVRVWGEDAQVLPFTESSPDVWSAEDGRVATLAFTRQAGCAGTALVTLGNGIKMTF